MVVQTSFCIRTLWEPGCIVDKTIEVGGCRIVLSMNRSSEEVTDNIDAYDMEGNHLWNIGELVGDIKIQFDWLNHISARDIKKHYGVRCARSDSLYACIAEGFFYIIDAKKQLLLTKISGQIR